MVEYSECLKSWISIPSGKDRPLLAGVFWSAEEVDIACDDVTMHAALLRWMTNSHIAVDDAKGLGEIGDCYKRTTMHVYIDREGWVQNRDKIRTNIEDKTLRYSNVY